MRALFVWLCSVDLQSLPDLPSSTDELTDSPTLIRDINEDSNEKIELHDIKPSDAPTGTQMKGVVDEGTENSKEISVLEYLHQLKDQRINHATLFYLLCKYVGIQILRCHYRSPYLF